MVFREAGVLVWCQDEATATATQEAAHCVNALMVTLIAVWVLTLINICMKDWTMHYNHNTGHFLPPL